MEVLSPSSKKKFPLKKSVYIFLYFGKCFGSNIKTFPIFSQNKAFLIFQEMATAKKFLKLITSISNFLTSNISGKGNLKTSDISWSNFQSSKNKKELLKSSLYFRKWNYLVSSKLLIFHLKTCNALKKKPKKSAWKKTLVFCDIFLIFTSSKLWRNSLGKFLMLCNMSAITQTIEIEIKESDCFTQTRASIHILALLSESYT